MDTLVKDEDTVSHSLFGWCNENNHANCKRVYRRFLVDPRNNKMVWLDEIVKCACKKRGCKCYTAPADRPKAVTRRRKK